MWYYIVGIRTRNEVKFDGEFHYNSGVRADNRKYTTLQFDDVRFSAVRCYFFKNARQAYHVAKLLNKHAKAKKVQLLRVMPVPDDFIKQYIPSGIWPIITGISVHLVKDAKFEK